MCEHCGCQALGTIDELTEEHERVLMLISRVRDTWRDGEIARMAELTREMASVLGPHTRVEEERLFPALAGKFPDKIAALRDEHRRIEAVLAEANGPFLTDPSWPERLIAVLGLLREHILKEQDGVFPAALALLDTGQPAVRDAARPVAEVVLGLNAREPAAEAIGFAFTTARLWGARLRAVHAWQFPSCAAELPFGVPEEDRGTWEDHEVQLLADALRPWREKYPEVEVLEDVRLFTPARALARCSAHAALVVVGRKSGSSPGTVRLLVTDARCPVAVVPS